jgi:hypothetical protein
MHLESGAIDEGSGGGVSLMKFRRHNGKYAKQMKLAIIQKKLANSRSVKSDKIATESSGAIFLFKGRLFDG